MDISWKRNRVLDFIKFWRQKGRKCVKTCSIIFGCGVKVLDKAHLRIISVRVLIFDSISLLKSEKGIVSYKCFSRPFVAGLFQKLFKFFLQDDWLFILSQFFLLFLLNLKQLFTLLFVYFVLSLFFCFFFSFYCVNISIIMFFLPYSSLLAIYDSLHSSFFGFIQFLLILLLFSFLC